LPQTVNNGPALRSATTGGPRANRRLRPREEAAHQGEPEILGRTTASCKIALPPLCRDIEFPLAPLDCQGAAAAFPPRAEYAHLSRSVPAGDGRETDGIRTHVQARARGRHTQPTRLRSEAPPASHGRSATRSRSGRGRFAWLAFETTTLIGRRRWSLKTPRAAARKRRAGALAAHDGAVKPGRERRL
jgi:hypothetical protein